MSKHGLHKMKIWYFYEQDLAVFILVKSNSALLYNKATFFVKVFAPEKFPETDGSGQIRLEVDKRIHATH